MWGGAGAVCNDVHVHICLCVGWERLGCCWGSVKRIDFRVNSTLKFYFSSFNILETCNELIRENYEKNQWIVASVCMCCDVCVFMCISVCLYVFVCRL